MKKAISIFSLLALTACNAPATTGITSASPDTQTVAPATPAEVTPLVMVTPDPTPSATPSPTPSPSPSPTPTVLQFNSSGQGPALCHAFADWDSADETIVVEYIGYLYTFAASGVTSTITTGQFNGQTSTVLDPVTLTYGSDECVVQVSNGAVQSIVQNF